MAAASVKPCPTPSDRLEISVDVERWCVEARMLVEAGRDAWVACGPLVTTCHSVMSTCSVHAIDGRPSSSALGAVTEGASAAGGTETVDVDGVMRLGEPFGLGERVELVVERVFQLCSECDISHQSA